VLLLSPTRRPEPVSEREKAASARSGRALVFGADLFRQQPLLGGRGSPQIPHHHAQAEASGRPGRQVQVCGVPSTENEAAHPSGYLGPLSPRLPSGARQPPTAPFASGAQSGPKTAASNPLTAALFPPQPALTIAANTVARRVAFDHFLAAALVTVSDVAT
jgi:hypothetical protein